MSKSKITYAQAGVSIDAGNELVNRIKPLAKATSRSGVDVSLGGFGALFDIKKCGFTDPVFVSGTDGVGTKLKVAQDYGKHNTIGIDLVAMSVNDIVVQGAEPLFFLDYFACGKLDVETATDVVSGIAEGCKQAGCALIGGETAEMPGMYKDGEYDLAGFCVGAVERTGVLPKLNDIKAGDALIGLASSGVHSNGYSLARKVAELSNTKFTDNVEALNNQTLGETLLTPTKIYVKSVLSLIKSFNIKAIAHITGGGITENLPRVLPENLGAEINVSAWPKPAIFEWIKSSADIEESEMLRTFNYGVGMIIVAPAEDAAKIIAEAKTLGEDAYLIGNISEKIGVNYK